MGTVRSDHHCIFAHLEMAYQFWPLRGSLAEVAKVFILALPYDQMWHCWKDSDSQCLNAKSRVVMKVVCLLCQHLRPLQQIHRAVGETYTVSRLPSNAVLLGLPCALHFNISLVSLCRCGERPTSAGVFFLSLFFFFLLGLWNLNHRQSIHATSSSACGKQSSEGSGNRSRDSELTSTLFFLTVISLEDK